MPTGYTTVSDTSLEDAEGGAVAHATIYAQPVRWPGGRPTSFQGGDGHLTTFKTLAATVTAGAFSIQLADTALTDPINIGYHIWCIDEATGEKILDEACIQPSGSAWSLDSYIPGTIPTATGTVTVVSGGGGGGTGGGGESSPSLVFASASGAKWRLAIASGVEGLEAYSGGTTAAPLYLLDQGDTSTIWQAVAGDDGLLSWTIVTGVTAVNSVAIIDDDSTSRTLTRAYGVTSWT